MGSSETNDYGLDFTRYSPIKSGGMSQFGSSSDSEKPIFKIIWKISRRILNV